MKWIILLLTVFSFTTIANKINFVPKASWGDASYHNIELVDNIAFIGTDGVLVLDLSDSTSPKKVTKIQIPIDENVIKIEKANNLLFVLTASEFFTIDVESLTNPQVISRINYNLNGKFVDFALADDKLFILQEESPHLLYYDLSDVANPQFSRSKSVQDATRPVNLRALEIVGNNLFVSSLYDTQLLSLQSSDFLTQIYYYETGLNSYSTGKSLAKSIGSKIIYLNSDTSKVELFDFTDTNQVKRELVYDGSSNSPRDFKITDDRLHVVTAAGVLQFSLKSENYLQKLSEISYPYEDSYSGIGIGGDYIVLVSSSHIEVRAYGTTLSRYSMSGNNFISLVNNKLVTGGKSARIFDLSNGSFALKNTIDWSSLHYDLTEIHVKENYFFNGNGDIYQISDDFQADNVSSFIKVNNIWSFRLNENRMIRAANGQLDVFDVSQPLASKLILSMTTSELPVHISDYTIKGNNIYGATNDGLYQIRINDSGQIIKQGYIRSDGYSHARLIHKDNLYEIVENQAIGYDLIIWDISNGSDAKQVKRVYGFADDTTGEMFVYKNYLIQVGRTSTNILDITIPSQSYLYEDSGFSIDISAWPEYAVHESALIFTQHGQLKYYEINEAPVVLDSTIVLSEDEAYLAALDIENLENDTLDYSITEQPSNGELTISEAGEVHYMPKVNFNGKDAFTLRVVDPYGGDDTRSINIIVASVNDLPEAKDSVHSVTTGATLTGQVIAEDVDNIASELSYEVVTNVTQGQLSLSSDGNFSYVANAGFVGEDFFVFKAKDPEQGETEGTAKITVKTKVIKEASKEGSSGGSLGYIAIVAFSLIFIRPRRQFQKH